jgi:hypothetical protein
MSKALKRALFAMSGQPGQKKPGGAEGVAGLGNRMAADYPRIAARAKREKAAIHWGDETGVRDQDQIGHSGKSSGGHAPDPSARPL